jgi:hypothetical protein
VLRAARPELQGEEVLTASLERGERVRALLQGAWRTTPPPLPAGADAVEDLVPLLVRMGSGALVWWRLRAGDCSRAAGRATSALHQAYRLQALQARLHERRIVRAFRLLRAAGVEPVLVKGWAAARLYPHPALRPYGDVDLLVPPARRARAAAALATRQGRRCQVDLHDGFPLLGRSTDDLYARSTVIPLGQTEIRVLGAADHLALLCLHMLRHGAWRPVWLCDIAAMLEWLPEAFDWRRCLPRGRRAEWVACTFGLAGELLGARVLGRVAMSPPAWLRRAVLAQWGRDEHYMTTPSMGFALRRPALLPRALRLRWPNAIEATVDLGGPFNRLPRLPFQVGECMWRAGRALVATCTR